MLLPSGWGNSESVAGGAGGCLEQASVCRGVTERNEELVVAGERKLEADGGCDQSWP